MEGEICSGGDQGRSRRSDAQRLRLLFDVERAEAVPPADGAVLSGQQRPPKAGEVRLFQGIVGGLADYWIVPIVDEQDGSLCQESRACHDAVKRTGVAV